MSTLMVNLFSDVVTGGLKRKAVVSCSDWALKYRVMGKPFPGKFSFRYHPWLKKMHDSNAERVVGMKAAQMGFTEYALNRVFYYIDIRRIDCLYVLPSKTPDASDFSASRFDGALDLCPHLGNLFSDVKNIGHKRAGSTNLYIRGSHSKSSLKSIPSGLIVLDELEEMEQSNVNLAMERQSGQQERQLLMLSTPRIPNRGIHAFFEETDQQHFHFRCPACSRWTELTFPDCLIITAEELTDPKIEDSHIICRECRAVLPHETKTEWLGDGNWIATFPNRTTPGFYINQLYSVAERPSGIAKLYLKSQYDKTAEQEFWNSKMGMVREVSGSRITDGEIDKCIGGYVSYQGNPDSKLVTMGVDQGGRLHYEIDLWNQIDDSEWSIDLNDRNKPRIMKEGFVDEFEQLDELIRHFRVRAVVIDGQPEKRKALELAYRFPGFVYLCYYVEGMSTRQLRIWPTDPCVSVDRTSWMDLALGRFHSGHIELPKDLGLEYRQHLKAPVRAYTQDQHGNAVGVYVTGNNVADHLAHARTYAEIALQFAATMMRARPTQSPR